jgi:hypothetical protein
VVAWRVAAEPVEAWAGMTGDGGELPGQVQMRDERPLTERLITVAPATLDDSKTLSAVDALEDPRAKGHAVEGAGVTHRDRPG